MAWRVSWCQPDEGTSPSPPPTATLLNRPGDFYPFPVGLIVIGDPDQNLSKPTARGKERRVLENR